MKPEMTQTCYKVVVTQNEYGDILSNGSAPVAHVVKWRQISRFNRGQNSGENTSVSMVWSEPDAGFKVDDVLLYDGAYYRIIEVIEARDLDTNNIYFLKSTVERMKDTSGVS